MTHKKHKKGKRGSKSKARQRYECESRAVEFSGGPSEEQRTHPAFQLLYQHFQHFLQHQSHSSSGMKLPTEVPRDA